MIEIAERILFLKKIHLFSGLSDDDLKDVAEALEEKPFQKEDKIIEEGTRGDAFFIIWSGTVKVTRMSGRHAETLAHLVTQDFFGEEELFSRKARMATITATSDGILLVLPYSELDQLLKRAPKVKSNFDVVISSHRLWRKLRFKWVRPDEAVYFLARKHRMILWRSLMAPAIVFAAPVLIMTWGGVAHATLTVFMGLFLAVLVGLWAIWLVVDWSNDYYVVTSQRVVWVEKVIGIFDSRQEAPLSTILSVGMETDMLGRLLGYGNIIVRTFVGKIPFNYVGYPSHAARLVEEYWGRTKERGLSAEKEAMKDALRKRLNLPTQQKAESGTAEAEPQTFSKLRRPSAFQLFLANIFKLRLEDGDTITYRKHGFVLWQKIWLPTMIILFLFAWWLGRIVSLGLDPQQTWIVWETGVGLVVDSLVLTIPIISIPFLLWWFYEYLDWTNDIFQVTPDQIIDIDKKPFGTAERRAAALENILSTEYQRIGLLGNIFNFGTVYIVVGGTKLEFQDVSDPATVQSDIDRRRMARQAAKAAAAAAADRERMAEWLATYHQNSDQFRREEESRRQNPE